MSPTLRVKVGDKWYTVEVKDPRGNPVRALVDGEPVEVDTAGLGGQNSPGTRAVPSVDQDSQPPRARATPTPSPVRVFRTPMPGMIVSVAVWEGDKVVTGDEICVLEAMKMHQVLRADWTGVVKAVHVTPGQQVIDDEPIVELE